MTKKNILWGVIAIALLIGTTSLAYSKSDKANKPELEPRAAAALEMATIVASNVRAQNHRDIDDCGSDVNCIGHVLLRAINGNGGGGGQVVYFYHSDSCDSSRLIRPVRLGISIQACESLGQRIRTRVWGIKYQGQGCVDISDKDFDDACIAYAAEQ